MFQFPAFASRTSRDDGLAPAGLPHSEIRGSMGICPSPRLIAACHVLLRLREPRHPPYALIQPLLSLDTRSSAVFDYSLPFFTLFFFFRSFASSCDLFLLALCLKARRSVPPSFQGGSSPARHNARSPTVCQCALFFLVSGTGYQPSCRKVCCSVVLGRVELPTSTLSV